MNDSVEHRSNGGSCATTRRPRRSRPPRRLPRGSIDNLSAAWVEHAFDKLVLPDNNTSRLLPVPNGLDRV